MIVLFAMLIAFSLFSAFDRRIESAIREPPLCGKSVITNTRLRRSEEPQSKDESSTEGTLRYVPYMASVQVFDLTVKVNDDNIFNKRLPGAFVANILGPTVVLVTCRCVARHLGQVGGVEGSTRTPRQFGVMAGTPWDYSPVDGLYGQIRFTSEIFVHPKCFLHQSVYKWDLAVLLLRDPFQISVGVVEVVPVPRTVDEMAEFLNTEFLGCYTAGWHWAFNSHKPKHADQELFPVFLRNLSSCRLSEHMNDVVTTETHLCVETAASFQRLRRTGDAGSPLSCVMPDTLNGDINGLRVLAIKSIEDDFTPDGFMLFTRLDRDLEWLWDFINHPPTPTPKNTALIQFNASTLKSSIFVTLMNRLWIKYNK